MSYRLVQATHVGPGLPTAIERDLRYCSRCGRRMYARRSNLKCQDCKVSETPLSKKLEQRLSQTEEQDEAVMDAALQALVARGVLPRSRRAA